MQAHLWRREAVSGTTILAYLRSFRLDPARTTEAKALRRRRMHWQYCERPQKRQPRALPLPKHSAIRTIASPFPRVKMMDAPAEQESDRPESISAVSTFCKVGKQLICVPLKNISIFTLDGPNGSAIDHESNGSKRLAFDTINGIEPINLEEHPRRFR